MCGREKELINHLFLHCKVVGRVSSVFIVRLIMLGVAQRVLQRRWGLCMVDVSLGVVVSCGGCFPLLFYGLIGGEEIVESLRGLFIQQLP